MRLLFITSGLARGSGGVADYTLLLAKECARLGQEVALLGLNDDRADGALESPALLRLGLGLPSRQRIATAQRWVEAFAPDAVSLQFVCYGFNPRGLCWSVADSLRRILGARPVQIMFHELWIGAERGAGIKHRLVGTMQRRCVLRLFSLLNVRSAQTTNSAYAGLLGAHGLAAGVLPLFGNLPASTKPPRLERTSPWRFLIFGILPPEWPPEPLFTQLRGLGVPVEIIHAGRIGGGAELWKRMSRARAGALTFRSAGELPPEELADLFSEVDFGISMTPWEIIGKSGSVAAMLEHGLPVIVNRDDVHYPGVIAAPPPHPLLLRMSDDLAAQLRAARRQPAQPRLTEIAEKFLASLEAAPAR